MISAMNYEQRIVRAPQIAGVVPDLKATHVTLTTVVTAWYSIGMTIAGLA